MNLEDLAVERAAQQLVRACRDLPLDIVRKAPRKPKARRSVPLACGCGSCTVCRERERKRRWRAKRRKSPRICSVPGCRKHVDARDVCKRHHRQIQTRGVALTNRLRIATPAVIERARAKLAARGIAA